MGASTLPRSQAELTNLLRAATLRKAGAPYFTLCQVRHTFATRLSAGGIDDHMVTQLLQQGDAEVFKLCSQAKLGMMRRPSGSWIATRTNGRRIFARPTSTEPFYSHFSNGWRLPTVAGIAIEGVR